ncbi:MAG TPA: PP2C family protein-serine/threonine phosphatase [Thermoanaerobaculia bacterium]|nr:PP2C family protein-serine/threonine phosphatase [Thermoanaerobaculia bacterium]
MRTERERSAGRRSGAWLAVWLLAGVAGIAALLWAYPRVFPFYPEEWTINREEAVAIALERFTDLGDPVDDAFVVGRLAQSTLLETRLLRALPAVDLDRLRQSLVARQVFDWQVTVYPPGARPPEWSHRARISPTGEVMDLQLRVPVEDPGGELAIDVAERRAEEFLAAQGFDLADFGEPQVRQRDLAARRDTSVRFPAAEAVFGADVPYGFEVSFAGERLTGYELYYDLPDANQIQASLQGINLLTQWRIMVPFLLIPWVGLLFLRRYHAGEVGVRRSVQLFAFVLATGLLLIVLAGAAATEGVNFGVLSRVQVAWAWSAQIVIFWFSAMAATAALSWSVGEALARERWPHKLAAFDAVFRRRFTNATVARSSFVGFTAGLVLAGGLLLLLALVPRHSTEPMISILLGPWWQSARWPGLALVAFTLCYVLFAELFARLFLVTRLVGRLGTWGAGALVAMLSSVLFWPVASGSDIGWSIVFGTLSGAALVALFLRHDLWTVVVASFTASTAVGATAFFLADDPFLRFQGALPLFAAALPMLAGLRDLVGGAELTYRWEDVPAHVRRIAERERQRVELETARRIQSSILPELPPQLHGVEISHAYLPASEVGGDFYDVLALEDGRLALAVGDVAGHGVSSGLVMSMAKSALAVQVAFDPEVAQVFRTLNRTVFQTARKRLLATLCYAVLDPARRELVYASAGHLFPYRIDRQGRVDALESIAYPLGVRGDLEVLSQKAQLSPGDTLFLFSDGIVEARREGGEDQFGFERLEEVLRACAEESVSGVRDAVLSAVEDFTGPGPQEDDLTVLVLRLPRAG